MKSEYKYVLIGGLGVAILYLFSISVAYIPQKEFSPLMLFPIIASLPCILIEWLANFEGWTCFIFSMIVWIIFGSLIGYSYERSKKK